MSLRSASSVLLFAFLVCCGARLTFAAHLPLPAARQVPPGTVVYASGGDLYRKDLPDGVPYRLTRDGNNDHPEWVPSGNWVTYQHHVKPYDTGILRFVSRNGRTIRTLGEEDEYSVNPANAVAFAEEDGISILSLETGKTRKFVTAREQERVCLPLWSPDGRNLAYTSDRPMLTPDSPDGQYMLCLTNTVSGARRTLYCLQRDVFLQAAKWSPDSRYLSFWISFSTGSVALDGVKLAVSDTRRNVTRRVTSNRDDDVVLHRTDILDFRTNDGRLALSAGPDRTMAGTKRLEFVDPHTCKRRRITSDARTAVLPAWSPDGRQLAYVDAPVLDSRYGDDNAKYVSFLDAFRLVSVSASGKQQRFESLHVDPWTPPLWLSDSRRLLVETWTLNSKKADTYALWMVDTTTHKTRCIADNVDRPGTQQSEGHGFSVWSPPTRR